MANLLNGIARPFGFVLMFLYTLVENYGVAIILFALVIKLILLPFQMKSKRGMMQQARLQPQVAELQKKHGTNKQKIQEETMKLYKEAGVNPASGCIWGFLPLPILLALFQVIRQPITIMMGVIAEHYDQILAVLEANNFTTNVGQYYVQIDQAQYISTHFNLFQGISDKLQAINFDFLFNLNFGMTPQWNFLWSPNIPEGGTWFAGFILFLIPLLSGGTQFLATRINQKMNPTPVAAEGQAKSMNTMMMLMPLISVYIAFITPAALGFYWTISTVFQIVQDIFLSKYYTKKIEAEEAVKNAERIRKEAEIEEKRLETERRKAEGLAERNPNTAKRKKLLTIKQGQIDKAAEWQKKNAPPSEETNDEPSRVGNRRYARGRAYDPDRYSAGGGTGARKTIAAAADAELDDKAEGDVPDDEVPDADIPEGDNLQDEMPDNAGDTEEAVEDADEAAEDL